MRNDGKKVEKRQVTLHLSEGLVAHLHERAVVNNRTLSGEVEHMLNKVRNAEDAGDRKALIMADSKRTTPVEPQ